jgi:tRNA A-37 threonylcarbamoyl transferase component Bud32
VNESRLPPRYRNPERIAQGGMGEIYRAEDADLERVVAIKVLAESLAGDDAVRARFTREALAAARLSNAPGAVTIYDVGEHADRPYIVMEYLPGGSLAERVDRQGAQPIGRALEWLHQAAVALDAAHANGIVHRDVKPANLLLDDDDRVHVADFGVASAAGLTSLTDAGTVVGTAGYLSPEQARGERATPASDRYALGVVAFELLTGSRPFERESATAEALAHVSAPIPPASRFNPDLPPQVDDVLARALAKEPQHRFAAATDFVHALRDALDDAAGRTAVGAVPPAGTGRRLLPLVLAAAGALLMAGVVAAALLNRDDAPNTAAQPTPKTVRETVTLEGTTLTVTTEAEPPPTKAAPTTTEAPTTTAAPDSQASPAELNDQGYALMRQGNFQAALPLLERAYEGLAGSGEIVEAYTAYNLAFTRLALGRCDGVLELLDRSEQVQGERKEISRLRKEAERGCGEGG